jgi:dTDP-4-amino-4,6-dideoxygalactose transaminase
MQETTIAFFHEHCLGLECHSLAKSHSLMSDKKEIRENIDRILTSGRSTLGEYSTRFDQYFARLVGVKRTVSVSSDNCDWDTFLRELHALRVS